MLFESIYPSTQGIIIVMKRNQNIEINPISQGGKGVRDSAKHHESPSPVM